MHSGLFQAGHHQRQHGVAGTLPASRLQLCQGLHLVDFEVVDRKLLLFEAITHVHQS